MSWSWSHIPVTIATGRAKYIIIPIPGQYGYIGRPHLNQPNQTKKVLLIDKWTQTDCDTDNVMCQVQRKS